MAIFTVNNPDDSGIGSLRQGIEDANNTPGSDEIVFDSSVMEETISLTSGQLRITDDLVITGLGADKLTINGLENVFAIGIYNNNSEIDVEIQGLTISLSLDNIGYGAAVRVGNSLTNLTVSNSIISAGSGVGILNEGDTLSVSNSNIYDSGTGILNFGTAIIDDSIITQNNYGIDNQGTATIENSIITQNNYGGIFNNELLTINNSTISNNTAYSGGGIANSSYGELVINNSTISGNVASRGNGGGIESRGKLVINNSTVTGNSSPVGGGIVLSYNFSSPDYNSSATIANSIITDNFNGDVDLSTGGFSVNLSELTSAGGNLIGTGNAVGAFDKPGDTIGVTDPGLDPLADNGGPTPTHAPQPDSPVINDGVNSLIPPEITTDQRGLDRIVGDVVDIGSVESEFTELPLPTVGLAALDTFVIEAGLDGTFRVSRTGSTQSDLTVNLSATGSEGLTESDFSLTGVIGNFPDYNVTIPSGQSFVNLNLTPSPDAEIESVESLTLDVVPNPAYRFGSGSAVISIVSEPIIVTSNTNSGAGSLRQAIELANAIPGNNTIEFDPSLAGESISLTSGELRITDDLVITGLGADQLTVDATGNSRIFNVGSGYPNPPIEVSFSGLTLTGSTYYDDAVRNSGNLAIIDSAITDNDGRGIYNGGTLSITNSTISGNSDGGLRNFYGEINISDSSISGNSDGGIENFGGEINISDSSISGNSDGGISNFGGEINISDSSIFGNTTAYNGGGISNSGELSISNSTISGNSADRYGGGISNQGILSVSNSTISGNSADRYGGGIVNQYGELSISNSTISGNSSESGGGINNDSGSLAITNSTITLNEASKGGGIAVNNGPFGGEITIANTIISDNLNSDINLDLFGGTNIITSEGNNLIGTGNNLDAFTEPGDAPGVTDPGLAPLADNGGPTQTHALLSESPAINAGNNTLIPTQTDQRGETRIQQEFVDIGAFESDLVSPLPLVSIVTPTAFTIEGGLEGVFQINRTGDPTEEVVVALTATATEGLNPSDYSLSGVAGSFPDYTVTIPAGQYASAPITLNALADGQSESLESLTLSLVESPGNYKVNNGSASGTVTIIEETLIVTNNNDNGPGSLREAIIAANTVPGQNFIEFDLSLSGETISLTSGGLAISDDVAITGLGVNQLTIDAQGNLDSPVISVDDREDDSFVEVSFSGITLTGGGNYGSAIFNNENLTITDSSISGNQSAGIENVDGNLTITNSSISDNQFSGIYNSRGLTIITNSTISDNQSRGISNSGELRISNSNISGNQDSGIYNTNDNSYANLTIVNSTISGNSSYSRGGGINNRAELTITNSTISGNSSYYTGGGIYNGGKLTITNSTISGNSSDGTSGGIDNSAELTITNSTISGNSSNYTGGGITHRYGQLSVTNSTITLNEASEGAGLGVSNYANPYFESVIANTIISGNLDSDVDLFNNYSGELVNNITSSGGNLIGTGNALDSFSERGDVVNVTDAGLGPLADNGGPTLTHLLESDSPGLDAGVDSLLPPRITTDQRGLPRISGAGVDIGSVELESSSSVLLGTPGRDTLIGGIGDETLTGFQNRDSLTGGGGSDQFVYTSVVDRIDTIADFEVNTDKIVLTEVLDSLNYPGNNAIADAYVVFAATGTNTFVQIDPDGGGIARPRDFILVENVSVNALNNANNFIF
jgi:hypothetical protein